MEELYNEHLDPHFLDVVLLPDVETLRILDPTTVNSDKLKLYGAPRKSGALSFTSVTRT